MMMDAFDAIAKVVVIGDSTVGKTCLILRYTQDIFRDNFLPTIGNNIHLTLSIRIVVLVYNYATPCAVNYVFGVLSKPLA